MKVQWSNWSEGFEREVFDAAEAIDLVKRLWAEVSIPAMVEFWDDATGRALAIGVGRSSTVLTYQDSNDPPYFVSRGAASEGTIWFCYGQEESEYLSRNQIPSADGVRAVEEFFKHRGRPACVSWEAL